MANELKISVSNEGGGISSGNPPLKKVKKVLRKKTSLSSAPAPAAEKKTSTRKPARQTRIDFEARISNLEDKIDGIETEKSSLLTENEELKKKAELIESAKLKFTDSMLGLSFEYPARFGKVNVQITEKGDGKIVRGEFLENDKFSFGCVSRELPENENVQKLSFLDSQGFLEDDKGYYFFAQGKDSKDYKLNPAKIINFEKGKALLVDKKSFVTSTNEEDLMVDIGENVGALINLNSEICRGLSFINSDFGMLPLNDFIEVVESMQLTN